MGFSSYHTKVTSPAKVHRRWKGGTGALVHWDGQANVEEPLPFEFAILEQTRRIQGFAPRGANNIRYYSNETTSYDDEIAVMAKPDNGAATEVIRGKYSDIKEKLPQGAKLSICLYIYNLVTNQIECLTLQGASLSAFIEFSKKNKIYESSVIMDRGVEKTMGSVKFFPPAFSIGQSYEPDLFEQLTEADGKVIEYQKSIRSKNTTGEGPDKIDQTPAQYEGEFSQEAKPVLHEDSAESPDETGEQNAVDFNSIPF